MALACREERGSATCTTLAGAVRMEIYPVGTLTAITADDPINKLINPSAIVIYPPDKVTDHTCAIIEITRYLPASLNLQDDDGRVQWSIISLGGNAVFYNGDNTGKRVRIYGTTPGEIRVEADYGWLNKAQFRAVVVELKQFKFRVSRIKTSAAEPVPTLAAIKKHIRIANIYLRQAGIKLVPDRSAEVATTAGNLKAGDPGFAAIAPFGAVGSNDPNIESVTKVEDGFFEVTLKNIASGNALTQTGGTVSSMETAIRLNAINEVISLAYVHSVNSPPVPPPGGGSVLGLCLLDAINYGGPPPAAAAPDQPRPAPPNGVIVGPTTITDAGTVNPATPPAPSTSWVAPNGLAPGSLPTPAPPVPAGASAQRTAGVGTRDGAGQDPTGTPATTVTMTLLPLFYDWSSPTFATSNSQVSFVWQPNSVANRDRFLQWGLCMDGQAHGEQEFGNTMAHELGHLFGLRHRRGNGPDGVQWPQWENLMDGSSPSPDAEDLDVLQCKAIRFSELFFRNGTMDTSAEVEAGAGGGPGGGGGGGLGTIGSILVGALVGAVVGAAVGAVIGAIIGGPHGAVTGALLGAGAGAVAGALAGGLLGS